jgi:hypothetical protein
MRESLGAQRDRDRHRHVLQDRSPRDLSAATGRAAWLKVFDFPRVGVLFVVILPR